MAKKFGDLFFVFSLIGLLIFSMISFGAVLQQENDVEDTILNDARINKSYVDLSSDLSTFSNKSGIQKDSFESDTPTAGFGSLLLFTIISGAKVFTGMILGIYNVIIVLPASILGVSEIVISVLTSLLLVSLILSAWLLYKLGTG